MFAGRTMGFFLFAAVGGWLVVGWIAPAWPKVSAIVSAAALSAATLGMLAYAGEAGTGLLGFVWGAAAFWMVRAALIAHVAASVARRGDRLG
jgi:hypothetical protein